MDYQPPKHTKTPEPCYGCDNFDECERGHDAEDLFWHPIRKGWYCDGCYQDHLGEDTGLDVTERISLIHHLAAQPNVEEAKRCLKAITELDHNKEPESRFNTYEARLLQWLQRCGGRDERLS